MGARSSSLTEALRTTVLTLLLSWAGLLLLGVAVRLAGPVIVWSEEPPLARTAWAPFPGLIFVDEDVREWIPCRRHALMIHHATHWDQQLRYLLVGMWGPYLAGEQLGIGEFHLRMEAEAERRERELLGECPGTGEEPPAGP